MCFMSFVLFVGFDEQFLVLVFVMMNVLVMKNMLRPFDSFVDKTDCV